MIRAEQSEPVRFPLPVLSEPLGAGVGGNALLRGGVTEPTGCKRRIASGLLATRGGACLRAEPNAELRDADSES